MKVNFRAYRAGGVVKDPLFSITTTKFIYIPRKRELVRVNGAWRRVVKVETEYTHHDKSGGCIVNVWVRL